jgi:hypothetical protein
MEVPVSRINKLCWVLICLAASTFAVGSFLAFLRRPFIMTSEGWANGTIALLLFAVSLRLMDMND